MTRHCHSCGHVHECEAPAPVTGPAVPPGGEGGPCRRCGLVVGHERWCEHAVPPGAEELRAALAAQETLRRVEALAEELEGHGRALVERPDQMPAFHGRQVLVIATALRRTLDGEPT